jgi:arylsulfatase A-like enzyme
MRLRSQALLAALVLAGGAALWAAVRSHSKPPDILLISIDSMRRDRASAYGYWRHTTPALERLAADGIRFDRAYTNGGFTLRSHMTMMTSLRPDVHAVIEDSGLALADDRTTLAEVLSRAGYRTAGFVDGGWMAGGFGLARGFDLYDDAGGGLAATVPKAMKWLTEADRRPSFLFLHTYDAHSAFRTWPYECPSEFLFRYVPQREALGCKDGRCASDLITWIDEEVDAGRLVAGDYLNPREQRAISAMYDGCLSYADHKLGELFEWLQSRSMYDDTLIVVLSDHGEEFLEHGMVGHYQEGYEEIVGIPLIVKLPAPSQGGRRVGSLAAMVDVMPTVLEIVGLAPPAAAQGYSLVPTFHGDIAVRKAVRSSDALITLGWKLLDDRMELLPIPTIPQWQENQYAHQPGRVAALQRLLAVKVGEDAAAAARLKSPSKLAPPIDGLLRQRLRSLGYLAR